MVSASALVELAVIVSVNAALAALATRYFRYQMNTRWGAALFTLVFVPLGYLVTTLVLAGFLGLGSGLFSNNGTLLAVTWALPFALGVSFDLFWMPAPEEVELPASAEQK